MELIDLIKSRRTIRQFQQKPIPDEILMDCVDAAHVAPSAMNMQALEFVLVTDPAQVEKIFPCLHWAGYIQPKGDPKPGQHPVAYLIILINEAIRIKWTNHDVGAAVENFLLAALSYKIGSCWLASVDRKTIQQLYKISESYSIDSVIALGYPAESPIMEINDDTVKYWQDRESTLHVPKRSLATILHINSFE